VGSRAVQSGKAGKFSILFTSDIHSQLHTHDEFFLENGKPVYKKRGGYGVLKTMVDTLRNEDPANTIVIDGGDCFQGGGVAAKSEGRAIVPLMNRVGYDLLLPGNWEVVYGKENMLKDLGGYHGAKICANMWHEKPADYCGRHARPQRGTHRRLIFQPYWTKMVAGVKIGFIGYNDPLTPKRQSPEYSCGIQFTKPE
jgi:S-sulfosulfanyl-L-cysteine sulfohydrolase